MKAMLLPLTSVEATAATGDESTPSEKGAGQGFDAVLALVSAQAATTASAPKPAAPAVPPQSEGNAAALLAQPAARAAQGGTSAQAADRAASVSFGPWLAGSAISAELAQPAPLQAAGEQLPVTPALPEQTAAEESGEAEPMLERADSAPLAPSQDPRVALPAGVLAPQLLVAPQTSAAPQAPVEVHAAAGSRASALGRVPAQSPQQPAQDEAVQAQAAQLFQRELLGAQPTDALQPAPAQGDATKLATARASARPAAQLAAAVAQAGAARPALAQTVQAPRTGAQLEPSVAPLAQAAAASDAQLAPPAQSGTPSLAAGARAPAAVVPAAQELERSAAPAAQGAAATAVPAAAQELESMVSADPRVTVRMLESAEPEQAPAALPEGEGIAQAALAAAHDERPESEATREGQQLEAQAAHGANRIQPAASFQNAEVQGARGLEAVVASLLRAGNRDASVKQPAARFSAARSAQLPAVETTASGEAVAMRVKLAEGAGNARDALTQERDEREPALREQLELPLPHALMQPELAPAKETPVAQPASPMPVLPQPLDPDALQAGKPGQTGASITIDHPELGPMDLLVQSQNGRIEVRAILETPHAAQVLRAHESALRYGIQQAGMSFGALRVRTRTGDGETVKARDNVKQRRRDHEWEA
jgi:hypothetical protein